jgi:cation/acetate symporter
MVAGLVISASGAIAHDVYSNVLHRGEDSEDREVWVGKIAAAVIGALAIVVAIAAGKGFNVQFLVGLAFSIAASANFPALVLALTWRRFNTTGALVGVAVGLISSVTLIILSPAVWPGPDHEGGPFPLSNPALVSVPLGFIACVLGTLLAREGEAERSHGELRVRAETGLGAET